MSVNDVKAVKENWMPMHNDIITNGVLVFQELFKINDSYIDKFSGIREGGLITITNSKLREHAVRVMCSFDSWIIALNDAPVLEGLLLRQGHEHVPRKVFKQHFLDMKKALIVVMGNHLGAKFNRPAFDNVYEKILALLLKGQE